MTLLSYSDKLKSPLWQKKRLDILNRDQFTCQLCSDTTTELQIHHKEYIKGRDPWEYEDENFQTLCKHCHFVIERYKNSFHILACNKVRLPGTGFVYVSSIIKCKEIDHELVVSIDAYYDDGSFKELITIRRQTIIELEKLFQYSEKLLINGEKNV